MMSDSDWELANPSYIAPTGHRVAVPVVGYVVGMW